MDFEKLSLPAADRDRRHVRLNDLHLYAATVLIWGSTWLAIKFQLGTVPPAVSVVQRFVLAALILFAYAWAKRLPLRFSPREHAWLALEGITYFGINYVAVYLSEQTLTSGLVAVVFSLMAFFNLVTMRLFYGTAIRPRDAAARDHGHRRCRAGVLAEGGAVLCLA